MLCYGDVVPRDPIVTGSSVVAIKYKDGVMMAADTLGGCPPRRRRERAGDDSVLTTRRTARGPTRGLPAS